MVALREILLPNREVHKHTVASLYEAFLPAKALELAKRLEIHYTPKHGSWLNIAEIEINVMTMQYLDRRIPTIDDLNHQLSAWESARNVATKHVDWQFSTLNARDKLKQLYLEF